MRGYHRDGLKKVPEDVARQVNVHHQRRRLRGTIHKRAENLEGKPRVAQLCGHHMVAGLSFEKPYSSKKGAFCLKNLAEYVEHAVFVFEVTHI